MPELEEDDEEESVPEVEVVLDVDVPEDVEDEPVADRPSDDSAEITACMTSPPGGGGGGALLELVEAVVDDVPEVESCELWAEVLQNSEDKLDRLETVMCSPCVSLRRPSWLARGDWRHAALETPWWGDRHRRPFPQPPSWLKRGKDRRGHPTYYAHY